jgi:single-strand DNA-binding protein
LHSDYNNYCFIGRLVNDRELRYNKKGKAFVHFTIASNNKINKEKVLINYFDMKMFGDYALSVESFLKKGQQVQVSGTAEYEKWIDKNTGKNRSRITFNVNQLQLLNFTERKF